MKESPVADIQISSTEKDESEKEQNSEDPEPDTQNTVKGVESKVRPWETNKLYIDEKDIILTEGLSWKGSIWQGC